MIEILPLEVDPRPPDGSRQPLRQIQRRRSPDVVPQIGLQLAEKLRVDSVVLVGVTKLLEGPHQRLRDEAPAVRSEMAARVGKLTDQPPLLRFVSQIRHWSHSPRPSSDEATSTLPPIA